MVSGALAPSIAMPSEATILTRRENRFLGYTEEEFQLPEPNHCGKIIIIITAEAVMHNPVIVNVYGDLTKLLWINHSL